MPFDSSVDRSGMRQNLLDWPLQVRRSLRQGRRYGENTPSPPPRVLLWVGMGGSAIGGDLCASLAASHAPFPLVVHRGGPLPAWVGPEDRLLLVSFSGGTAETLATAEEAVARKVPCDVLTSGGRLEKWAAGQGLEAWKVPGGRPPRAALGDLFATAWGALAARGWCRLGEEEETDALAALEGITKACSVEPGEDSHPLAGLLTGLHTRLPMVYGTGRLGAAAHRWATQINENAKRPAHWGVLPEMNHNEVVAYIEGSEWARRGSLLLLVDPDSPDDVQTRARVTLEIARDAGWWTWRTSPAAATPLGRLLETVALGDWLSFWMALEAGVDPTPIAPIDRLKAAL
ncbi:MAG TPA: hypothetical protein ENI92_09695 [Bacteroidetes bacterium]|nr:hypothetical protein [Bacteroidota bacterium]